MKFTKILSVFSLLITCLCFGQGAKKPKIMVVPSDALMNKKGLLSSADDMGEEVSVQYYNKAFLDVELKAIISKFGEMMKERGFETIMLEHELKRVQGKGLQINYDIRVDLTYEIRSIGPKKELYAEFSGIDVYSNKQIAAASGVSAPAIGVSPVALLQEAVLDKIDQFNHQLFTTFNEMTMNGRESRLTIIANGISLDEEMNGKSIMDYIEDWLNRNCIKGNFSTDDSSEERMEVSQAMMPLFDTNGKSLDARNFYRNLEKSIQSLGLNAKMTKRKLAEVEITINK